MGWGRFEKKLFFLPTKPWWWNFSVSFYLYVMHKTSMLISNFCWSISSECGEGGATKEQCFRSSPASKLISPWYHDIPALVLIHQPLKSGYSALTSPKCLVNRPTRLICISDIYLLTYKYKRHSRAICYPLPYAHSAIFFNHYHHQHQSTSWNVVTLWY